MFSTLASNIILGGGVDAVDDPATIFLPLPTRPLNNDHELQCMEPRYTVDFIPCAACGYFIRDRFYLASADRFWHQHCLRCACCEVMLDNEQSCYFRRDVPYCKPDYYRLFVAHCGKCSQPISPKDLVMRAKHFTFHLQCFTCNVCDLTLKPGDYFGLDPNQGILYCQQHYEPLIGCPENSLDKPEIYNRTANSESQPKQSRSKKRKNASARHDFSAFDSNSSSRSKRMRTSFKISQLKTMKEYFALNHNPDAKDLKQLSHKTGLTKRVLQVWFQNARAKYRRSLQSSDGAENSGDNKDSGDLDMDLSFPSQFDIGGQSSSSDQDANSNCSNRPLSTISHDVQDDIGTLPFCSVLTGQTTHDSIETSSQSSVTMDVSAGFYQQSYDLKIL